MGEQQKTFSVFGSTARLIIGPSANYAAPPEVAMIDAEILLQNLHKIWTRFEESSALSKLNNSSAATCTVPRDLALAIEAGLWAAERSNGLVDPLLVDELEAAGYTGSREGVLAASLKEALLWAPARHPARPKDGSPWRQFAVDLAASTVSRPPGARFDTGGSGKGLAADLLAKRMQGYLSYAIDIGGDMRIGGVGEMPRQVSVQNPFARDSVAASFPLITGAVATSGIAGRIWETDAGFAHHLLDPSTGEPAWTGIVQATALGQNALDAETLAKMAFLSGPERAQEILSGEGGVLVLDDGETIAVNIADCDTFRVAL